MSGPDRSQPFHLGVDVVAGSTLLASVMSWLPTAVAVIGGLLSIVWFIIQINESRTYQDFLSRRRERKRVRRLRRLKAKQKRIEAKILAHVNVS